MLDHNFTVKYTASRNCFLILTEANIRKLSFQKVVRMKFGIKEMYFSCVEGPEIKDNDVVGIPSVYAKALGIREYQSVTISDVLRLPNLGKITVSPVSNDDYEILELSSDKVQSTLLDQVRAVNKNQKLTIWISKWLHTTVNVDDTEPMSYGYLANLSEVHVSSPKKSKSIQENNHYVRKSSTISRTDSTTTTTSPSSDAEESSEEEDDKECYELQVLKKYLKIKKPVVFRVCPLATPKKLSENDFIVTHPFNVFIFKQDLPSFITSNNFKDVMLCKITRVEPPTDFRESKEENKDLKNDLVVRVCVIEEYFNSFSDDIKSIFGETSFWDKHPTIFVPEKTMSFFELCIGSKVLMGNNFNFQSDVRSLELTVAGKKVENIRQKFKTYLAEHVKHAKLLLNTDFLIEIENNVTCCAKFNPYAEFCLFDEHILRNCKIYENTDKHLDLPKNSISNFIGNGDEMYTDIGDCNKIIQQAETLLSLKYRNENVLIVGKSGSGKTTVARKIAKKLSWNLQYMHVVLVSCKKLKGKSVESLHKAFSQDFQNMIYYQPSLLILDDLHIICGKTETGTDIQTQESVYFNRVSETLSELINMHQKSNRISVVATTESTHKINENIFSSRGKHLFRNVYKIPELNKMQREAILQNLFLKKGVVEENVDFDSLSVKTEGFVIQDLADFVNKSVFEAFKRNVPETNDQSKPTISSADIEAALKNSVALALRDVKLHAPGEKDFKDVGGLDTVKKNLIESLMWPAQYPELFSEAPLRLQSGMLLYGPPGVGKTLLVGAAARQCGVRLIAVKGPELLSKYIGASEQGVRAIFEKAQSARPCILFFDEFESLAARRGHDSTGVTDRVVNQLLTALDGAACGLCGVTVLAATSRPDLLDPALLRPGRLDVHLLCPLPDQAARLAILKALSRSLQLAKEVDLKKTAAATKGFSGADLQSLLYTAQLSAVEEQLLSDHEINSEVIIIERHMEEALRNTSPSLTKQEAHKYDQIYSKFLKKKDDNDATIKKQKITLA